MKKIIGILLLTVIVITSMFDVNLISAKSKTSYKSKYCKQVKELTTDDLKKMAPEKFSYSFLDMDPLVTLHGPQYNFKTKNYDDKKFEYVKIVAQKDGTLTFSCDGEFLEDAPAEMECFQFGFYIDDNPDFEQKKKVKNLSIYSGGQYCRTYHNKDYSDYSYEDQYVYSDERDEEVYQGFSEFSMIKCKDRAFSVEMKKGEAIYIGCGQNSYKLRACFMPGKSSYVHVIKGDVELLKDLRADDISISVRSLKNTEYTIEWGGKTETQRGDYYSDIYSKSIYFYQDVIDGFAGKAKLTIKADDGRKCVATIKTPNRVFINRPDSLGYEYKPEYNYYYDDKDGYSKTYISGIIENIGYDEKSYVVKVKYRGKTYTTKSTCNHSDTSQGYYKVEIPGKLKAGKKIKITVIKDGEEFSAVFRVG